MLHIIGLILLAVVLIALGSIFFNTTLIFSFLYADYNLRSSYKPKEYIPASNLRYLKNFWIELFYILGKYYLLPLRWVNLTVKGKVNSDTAILMIHGYCRNQTDWWWLRGQLKKLKCPLYFVNLTPEFAAIEDITKKSIPDKIQLIKQQTRCRKIILVGHSMGGLVASYYSEFLDHDNLVQAVITIGSPLAGTRIAFFGKGENAKQMCPGSEFLQQLHVRLQHTPQKYYQIASKFDNMIYPWQSAMFEGTPVTQKLTLDFTGHLQMLHAKEVAGKLQEWIAGF